MAADDPAPPDATPPADEAPTRRRGPGRQFQPGNRANPGGRPKTNVAVKAALERLTPEAVRDLRRLMRNPGTPPELRARVDMYIIDRQLGRAPLAIGGLDGAPLVPPGATTDNPLTALVARLVARKAASAAEAPAPTEPENAQPGANGAAGEGPPS